MNTKQFQYVIVLARAGSFSKAAIELNISQPSLSQYVKKIEQEVGAPLFIRAGGNIRLTDVGRAFVDAGEKILSAEKDLENKISALKNYSTGTLSVGISHSRTTSKFPSVIKKFKERFPGVCVVINERTLGDVFECAERGDIDFAIVPAPYDKNVFDAKEILKEKLFIAVPQKMLSELNVTDGSIKVRDLDGLPFIVGKSSQAVQSRLDEIIKKHGIFIVPQVMVKRLEMQREMVKNGIGIALLPKKATEEDGIVYLSLQDEKIEREIVAIYRKDGELSFVGQEFIRFLQEAYNE